MVSGTGQSNEKLHMPGLRQMGSLNRERVTTVTAPPQATRVTGNSWPVVTCRLNSLKHGFSQDAVPRDTYTYTGVLTVWQEYIQVQALYSNHFALQVL
jgi:hypothetical protein